VVAGGQSDRTWILVVVAVLVLGVVMFIVGPMIAG
jgi:hypothetical protein